MQNFIHLSDQLLQSQEDKSILQLVGGEGALVWSACGVWDVGRGVWSVRRCRGLTEEGRLCMQGVMWDAGGWGGALHLQYPELETEEG